MIAIGAAGEPRSLTLDSSLALAIPWFVPATAAGLVRRRGLQPATPSSFHAPNSTSSR